MVDTLRVEKMPAPLRQRVVDNLRGAITGGRFRAGDRLVERELCDAIGVSRTLIREALRQLEAEGLVSVLPNKGPIVALMTAEEARGLYQVRAVLEGWASRLFIDTATEKQKAQLRQAFNRLTVACEADNFLEASAAKNDFYVTMFSGSGNETLLLQLNQLFARTSILRSMTLNYPNRLAQSAKEIEKIFQAVMSGDKEAAWNASVAHVESAAAILMKIMKAREDS